MLIWSSAFSIEHWSSRCPVAAFELYLEKLNPNCEKLWQKSRKNVVNFIDPEWYYRIPMGHDPLETFMKKLSIKLELSDHYTNHCICATCTQTLDDAGYEAHHIIALSSHKSESTVKKYATKCPDQKKCQMSRTLHGKLHKKPCLESSEPTADPPLPTNFDLLDFDPEDDELLEKFLDSNQHLLDAADNIPQPEETAVVPSTSAEEKLEVQGTKTPHGQEKSPSQEGMQQNIQNFASSRFSMPIIPKMYSPRSNVTINYNFGK